jgi:hypothetical protein
MKPYTLIPMNNVKDRIQAGHGILGIGDTNSSTKSREDEEIDEIIEEERQLRLRPLPQPKAAKTPANSAPLTFEEECMRRLVDMIFEFLFGKTPAEAEASVPENAVERVEWTNKDVHEGSMARLASIIEGLEAKDNVPGHESRLAALEAILKGLDVDEKKKPTFKF